MGGFVQKRFGRRSIRLTVSCVGTINTLNDGNAPNLLAERGT